MPRLGPEGFSCPGPPGSAPPLLAQHDWVHVLADYGSTVESELEVFERAVEAGSVSPWEPGGISPLQYRAGREAAAAARRPFESYGAVPGLNAPDVAGVSRLSTIWPCASVGSAGVP